MIDQLECPVYPEMANDFKKVSLKWRFKDLTIDFDVEICEVSCKHYVCIDDFRWRPEPTIPPAYAKYRAMIPKDREKYLEENPTLFVKGKIYEYLEERDRIRNFNTRNMNTLMEWLKLPVSPSAHNLVEKYLNTFSGNMNINSRTQQLIPKEVQELADKIGGKVV